MPNTPRRIYRGSASTSSSAIYTVPASTTTIVTNVVISNDSPSTQTFALSFGGVTTASAVNLSANSITALDIKQVLTATESISILGTSNAVKFHISGVEVT